MLNDRFNSDSKNGLKDKLRDKKFVSIVAIGIFVLILVIVLIAKGCSGSSETAVEAEKQVQPVEEFPAEPPQKEETDEERGRKLLQEGINYYNGDGSKPRDYEKAKECFIEAKNLGIKAAEPRLKLCESKLKKAPKK